jgi:wyosine [tRNA(Phe)-imidazoG37] synthetase (radical SAM superfamily)
MSAIEYRQEAYKPMTTDEYQILMDKIYSEFRDMVLSGTGTIVPKYLGIHISNRGCSAKCVFCVSGGAKHEELSLSNPDEFIEILQYLLQLKDDKGNYIKEIHFDGDSSDPILPKTRDLFCRTIDLIEKTEETDGLNRLIQVITNGHFVHRLPEIVLNRIDLFNISVNASNDSIYELYSGTSKSCFNRVIKNIESLCRCRDKHKTNQIINVSHIISRDAKRGITNFFESEVKSFTCKMRRIGVNGLKFRFDFHEHDSRYQDYVTKFIREISDSGDYKPLNIYVQMPSSQCSAFKHCLSPFLWPVIGPDHADFFLSAFNKKRNTGILRTRFCFVD